MGPDRRPARGRADPRRAVVDVHGPADPRARRARLGLRAAGAAHSACPGAQRRDHPAHGIRRARPAPARGRDPGRARPRAAAGACQPLYRAPAAVPGRQRPRARLRPARPAGQRPLRRQLHLVSADAARDGGGTGGHPHRPAVGARGGQHARLRGAAPAARRRGGPGGRAGGGADQHGRRAGAGAARSRRAASERARRELVRPRRATAALRGARDGGRQSDRPRRRGGRDSDGGRPDHLGQAGQRAARHSRRRRRTPASAAVHARAPARSGPAGARRAALPDGRAAARGAARGRSRAARGRPPARGPDVGAPAGRSRSRRRRYRHDRDRAGARPRPPRRPTPSRCRRARRAPTRPRILSYVGRWGRARRWLPEDALRVLDIGCSFAYGSAAIQAGGPEGRVVVGVERDPRSPPRRE